MTVKDGRAQGRTLVETLTTPKLGDGATYRVYSDRHACTVVAVSKNGKQVTLQRDTATLLNGFKSGESDALVSHPGGFAHHVEGIQRYKYECNPTGQTHKLSLRKNGRWKLAGDSMRSPGCEATFNGRHHFYDFNF